MPRLPGRTRQRWPQAKQRTAPPSTCSTSSPSRTRASSTWASVAAPPSGASWVRKEVMVRCVMGGLHPEIYAGPALPQGPRRELIEQQRGGDVLGREVPHLRHREHDVGRVRRVVETDQVPDLVERDDPDVVQGERAAGGVERGERDHTTHEVAILVPGEVGLTGPLDLELESPVKAHLGRRGVRVEVE